jgi:predicted dehydrogenase
MAIKTALVGYGNAGKTFHSPLIDAAPSLDLAAVVSTRPEAVHANWPDVAVVGDFATVLADPSIELVVIATPNQMHAPQAIAALQAGKNVVVDKPFALSAAEAQTIVDAAKASGKLCVAFQNRRWDSHVLTFKRLLDEGRLGDVAEVFLRYDRLRPVVPTRWRDQDLPGSGMLYDLGAHLVDQAVFFFGKPDWIMADVFAQRPQAMVPDYFNLILAYGRTRVIVHSGMINAVPGAVIEAQGTRGVFVKYGQDTQEASLMAGGGPKDAGFGVDPSMAVFTPVDGLDIGAPEPVTCGPGHYVAYYEAVAGAIRGDAPSPVPLEQSLLVMRLLDLAIQSAREGKRLEV